MTDPRSQDRRTADEPIVIELNPRERRLYDRLRSAVTAPRPGASSGFLDLLLFLPDVVVLLLRLLRDDRVPLSGKAVALMGVGYVLSPIDLLPEVLLGPIGLVDDLLVVAAALSRLLHDVHPDVVRSHWPGHGDALEVIHRITGWAERIVGGRFSGIWRRVGGLFGRAA
jgi:uncharacterized membrane protein YkvA (DUF1232 family)